MTATTDDTRQFGHCDEHGDFEIILFEHPICPMCKEARKVAERDARQAEIEKEHAEAKRRRYEEQIAICKARVWVPKRFTGKGFDAYKPRTPSQQAALTTCRGFAADATANVDAGRCLVLLGPKGVGKSHLLNATLTAIAGQLIGARYATMAGFLADVRGNWAWHGGEDDVQQYITHSVLAIDEMWLPEHGRDKEAVFALVDERYRECRPTLIGSNLSWAMMRDAFGERLCDRLLEGGGIVLGMDGESMRGKL